MKNINITKQHRINLMQSKKIGIEKDRLAALLSDPEKVPTLLVVLSDAGQFHDHLTSDPEFARVDVTMTDGPIKAPAGTTGISISSGKIPGDMAMIRVPWSLVEKMVVWSSVFRIEEPSTFYATRETKNKTTRATGKENRATNTSNGATSKEDRATGKSNGATSKSNRAAGKENRPDNRTNRPTRG